MSQPKCPHGCRMVPLLPELWLCDHASYGRMAYLKGCVEEARRLLERQGGYARLREDLDFKAEEAKLDREERQREGAEKVRKLMRKI